MEQDKVFKTRWFKWVVFGFAELALMLLVFWGGMSVGLTKANFNYRWGEQYHKLFGGPRGGWFMMGGPGMMGRGPFGGDTFVAPHGVVGTVLSVATSSVTIVDQRTSNEQSLVVTPNTAIRKGNENIKTTDLKPNDRVVVIGSPSSSGQIEVQFMRVFEQR